MPSSVNLPMSSFPKQYDRLPTVSFVIPNLDHDIHDGTIKEADDWLKSHLSGYIQWAKTHNSMLVVTWDEDDMSSNNKIPTLIIGPMVAQKTITQKSSHYSLLRTLEDLYGLDKLGHSEQAVPLDIWKQ
ncbi:alkaline phosphatase family protein [Paenibacillus stellifer]|uniref:alkaline phosphatase family protein n=1 Tax=Paenibacillus stellifer TaxID=169760 RepID=UPI00068E14E9|nr:alkaline phosphatase family protein [Paenibacillus stellifer]